MTADNTDHDLLIKVSANVDSIQIDVLEIKKSIVEIKAMCGTRLPHCMGLFPTAAQLTEVKKDIEAEFEARDTWARWSLGLSITSVIAVIGMIVTLIIKLH
jgi:hypothetical protein